eukprot:scaffold4575_cov91-Skeletonema_dohrnii-CCMP3373.AAC.2
MHSARSSLRITRSCPNLIETLYNLSELPIAELIITDVSSLLLHSKYSCPQQQPFYLVAIVRRPIPLLKQTVQAMPYRPCCNPNLSSYSSSHDDYCYWQPPLYHHDK